MAAAADRRKYSRIDTGHVISVAPLERPDRLAVSKNVSQGGISFEVVGCEVGMDDVVRVTFNVDDRTVIAVGRVVWATEMDPITMEVGLEFIEIDPLALRLLGDDAWDAA
ncbi:MAG: PilZ domain-containing protein [Deltaproteobacteria bacterium]|jgi:hypothetical protein|nr:PilZ domain-containing protein [Deltaproteobacteria bacterium]